MRTKKTALMLGSVAIMSLLAGCQEYEFTDITADEIRYQKNFTEKFGDISNVPTWDFSTYNLNRLGLVGGPSYSNAATRATGSEVYENDSRWFYVPAGIEQWLTTNLKESQNNTDKGTKDFTLSMPSNDVFLIPVYQGKAGMAWDLYVTDGQIGDNSVSGGTTNERIWSKSQGIQVKKAGTGASGITYTDEVVATKTFEYTGYQRMDIGNHDKYIPLYDYLVEMGFNASTQWVKVEVSNIDPLFTQGGLQYITEDWHNFPSTGKTISGGSVTFECKDEEFLRYALKSTGADQVKLGLWNSSDSYNNSQVNRITITTYKKTTGAINDNDWIDISNLSTDENNRNTIGETIRAHAIKLKQDAFSGTFSMYLKITNRNYEYYSGHTYSDFANRDNQASTAGQMLALKELNTGGYLSSVLEALQTTYGNEDYKFMFLGCEDANTSSSDWDMNDIVFLLVGKELPEIHDKDTEIIKKRYMIEDLGGTYDFDFNDIVVDVTQVTKYTGSVVSSVTQTATLKHLSGTIPFKVKIGNKEFGPYPGKNGNSVQGGDGYDPTNDNTYADFIEAEITGWNPNTNNITVTTWPGMANAEGNSDFSDTDKSGYLGNLGEGTSFTFPDNGKLPYIIACDQTVQWMKELITIPTSWFTVTPKNNNPVYGGDTPSQDDDDQGDDTTPPNTDLNNGSITLGTAGNNTDWTQGYYTLDATTVNSLVAGDKFVITADKNSFQLVFNNVWTDGHLYTATFVSNNKYELVLTADHVTAIKADNKITFNGGNGVTISDFEVVKKQQGGEPGSGEFTYNTSSSTLVKVGTIESSKFTNATKISYEVGNGELLIKVVNGAELGHLYNQSKGSVTLSDTQKQALITNGMEVQLKTYNGEVTAKITIE